MKSTSTRTLISPFAGVLATGVTRAAGSDSLPQGELTGDKLVRFAVISGPHHYDARLGTSGAAWLLNL